MQTENSMIFQEDSTLFGGHQTFPMRYGWPVKGIEALATEPQIFNSDNSDTAMIQLGVGKNMVDSIKYWLQAFQLIETADVGYQASPLGELLFGEDGVDPYLEDQNTIWLLHWLLCANPSHATSFFWFFSRFTASHFSTQDINFSLEQFVDRTLTKTVAANTLKKDISVLLRMYAPNRTSKQGAEDSLDSPLSALGLMQKAAGSGVFRAQWNKPRGIHPATIGFALTQIFDAYEREVLDLDILLKPQGPAPTLAAVFRLGERELIQVLDTLIENFPGSFSLRETAGLSQIYLEKKHKPMYWIKKLHKAPK